MKVLVCGSRNWTDGEVIVRKLKLVEATEVIHGGARGADLLGAGAASRLGLPVKCYPARWEQYGKIAGHIRNREMLDKENPDLVIAFWDGLSRGTKNMIILSQQLSFPVMVVTIADCEQEAGEVSRTIF